MCRDAKGRHVFRRSHPPVYSLPTKQFGMRRDAARSARKGPQHDLVTALSQDGKSVSVSTIPIIVLHTIAQQCASC
jgi:hypothetical protein